MEPKMFASILTEKLEKIKLERDIEEKWDNKMIKNLSEVCELNKFFLFTVVNCLHFFNFSLSSTVNLAKLMIPKC